MSFVVNVRVATLALAVAIPPLGASAQEREAYPNRPIRMIVPYPPGGAAGLLSRIVADRSTELLGQPIVIEYKPGASGNIGAELVATAQPDGHTLLSTPPPPLVVNQSLFALLPFNPARFVPITVIASAPNVLVAHPQLNVKTVADLIAYAKNFPGKLNYASTGNGGTPHLSAEWFNAATGVRLTHIPYKGAQAYPALLSGEVDLMFLNLGDALPHIRAGKLTTLAIGGEQRSATLPLVPTLAETIPGFVSSTWFGIVATPGTPAIIAERLSAVFTKVLRMPEIERQLAELHFAPVGGSPAQTGAFLQLEAMRWHKVIRAAGIKPD